MSDREIDAATGYTLGANSFMRKPLDFEEFSRTLTAIGLIVAGLLNFIAAADAHHIALGKKQ